jgi:hypothetical protein
LIGGAGKNDKVSQGNRSEGRVLNVERSKYDTRHLKSHYFGCKLLKICQITAVSATLETGQAVRARVVVCEEMLLMHPYTWDTCK